jgi:RND family efflux transporter MFP subunit
MMHRISYIALTILFGAGLACRSSPGTQTAPPKPPEVVVSPVVERTVIDFEAFTGRIAAVESVDVRSRVTGYLNKVAFSSGDEVTLGQPLYMIDPRPFEASLKNTEGQKGQWQAKRDRAQADVARYESLVPTGAASAQDLDKARADLGEAVAAMQSSDAAIDHAKLDVEFSKITAPVGGQIGRSLIDVGNLIRADQDVLTTIVSLNPIYVNFNVNERSLLRFRNRRMPANSASETLPDVRALKVPVYVGLDNEEGYPHQGVINFADNKVDASTGSILVRGVLDNSKRIFKAGFYARVRLPTSEPFKAILVTDRAISTDQSQKFVYVVDANNIAQYRAVKLGPLEDDGLRVVSSGLQAGDSVIVTGMQRARPGKPVTPQRIEMPRLGPKSESRPAEVVQKTGQH